MQFTIRKSDRKILNHFAGFAGHLEEDKEIVSLDNIEINEVLDDEGMPTGMHSYTPSAAP